MFTLIFLSNILEAQSRHEIGISYAPNYFIRTSGRLLPHKQDKIAISNKIGLIYKLKVANKIKISTGFNYSLLKEHCNYDYSHNLPPSEYEFLFSQNSSFYNDRETLSSLFYFFEIPIILEYFISENFFISTGFSNTFFFKHELWTNIDNKNTSIYNYSPYLIEYNLGIGFFKKITSNMNFSINPYFQTSINQFMSKKHLSVDYKNYINQLGINLNLTFYINQKKTKSL